MNARASKVSGFVDPGAVVAPATPWDIFFLLSEVAAGVAGGHFNQQLGNFSSQIFITRQCAKAILYRQWGIRRLVPPYQFVSARFANSTVGAGLARTDQDAEGRKVMTLDYLVVDPQFRRHGIGQMLVQHLMENAQAGAVVQVRCTPKSAQMQHLLRRLGFTRTQKAALMTSQDARVLMPDVWEWQR